MAKLWHLIVGFVILGFLVSVILVEKASKINAVITMKTFTPIFILVAIAIVIIAIWKLFFTSEPFKLNLNSNKYGLTMAQAKFMAATHLLENHGIDLFATGSSPDTARYIKNICANRCYPAAGEESWYIRLKITDKKYCDGMPTKILIYIDGRGNITDDYIMNNQFFINDHLWKNPELHYIKGISKTSKPRSLKELITRQVEETGDFPKNFQPGQFEQQPKEESKQ